MFSLTTKRLFIRQFRMADEELLYRIFGDAEVMKYGDGVQTKTWIRNWLQKTLERYDKRGFGPYVVLERNSQDLIGYCGLFDFPDVNGKPEIEIGYRFARSAWGKGFASEAALAVRDFAFNILGIQRLIAMIDPSNTASIRVAQKIGMEYEQDVMFDGYTHPDHVYAIHHN